MIPGISGLINAIKMIYRFVVVCMSFSLWL
jgi:hypothetical protein